MTFRRAINRIHLWLGLISALPVLILSVTGTLLVFEEELIRWEYRLFAPVTGQGDKQPLQACLDAARKHAPDMRFGTVYLPQHPRDAVRFLSIPKKQPTSFGEMSKGGDATPWVLSVDPYTATVIDQRKYGGGIMPKVRELHLSFLAGKTGHWVAGISTIIFLLIVISGLVLWFKRGGGWRKLFIKWDAKGKRFHYDLHANFGFYSSAFLLLIALSGVMIWVGAPWRDGLLKVTKTKWRVIPKLATEDQPKEGAALITLDTVLAAAQSASPETRAKLILLPRAPKDAISVSKRFWWGSRPTLTVAVHPVTGAVFDIDDPRDYGSGQLIHRLNRGLHSGEIGTALMRLLWLLASLVPLLLVCTGWKLWRKPPVKTAVSNRPGPMA